MKKTSAISLLLSLSLVCAMLVPGASAYAENGGSDSGMVIQKTATANSDGSYTITMEAYATGEKVISEVTEDVPTDIVLVLDQSGSMAENMSSAQGFTAYSKQNNHTLYGYRFNGGYDNLYYPVGDGYVQVSVEHMQRYTAYSASTTNYSYHINRNNLYYKDSSGQYQKMTVSRSSNNLNYTYTYSVNGTTIATSPERNGVPNLGDYAPLYYLNTNDYIYTYSYQLEGQERVIIETSEGRSTVPTETYYRYGTVNLTRLDALKDAVSNFSAAVAEKAAGADGTLGTEDDVNHRIAVVGFASGYYYENDWDSNYYNYGNTEVFVGATQYTYNAGSANGASNANSAQSHYSDVFQDMDTTQGQANITASIGALAADGGTLTNLGMEMASGILKANPVQAGKKRNRVVIVFTDGVPGWSGYDSDVASAAITQGNTAKKTYGASVYTVGIFSGADATSAGNENGNETQKANWFMQNVSSNNGSPQSPSYYLSAADADTLNSIFQQISEQIEEGGSSTTLNEATVIKDIIAPAFTLPASTTASDITLETYACTGKDGDTYTWAKNDDAMGATAVIGSTNTADATTTNNQVSVTGFNFAENYVGTVTQNGVVTGYRGHKQVIKFTVTPRPGFFGGNGVFTNTSAGVYENAQAENPVLTYDRPTVDVPLAKPDVTVPEANVYLGAYYSQTVPADAVKMGATVKIGGYDIDFSKANDTEHPYGLEPWQVEYVNISISAAATNGGSFENIQEDISYTVTVTVSPKTPGTSGDQSTTDTGTGAIHVFKPQLTFKDSDVWYGGAAPESYSGNLAEETWVNSNGTKKHDDVAVTMLNTKPTLTLNYTPEAGKIDANSKINTKQDIPVKVDVTMPVGQAQTQTNVNAHTTFKHTDCDPACGWSVTTPNGDPAFLLHVKTCTLEIKKSGGAADESYVFDVYKDGEKYSEVTVWGNGTETLCELPVGNYTIAENTGWSWRYTANNGNGASLTAANPNGSITCTNSSNGKIYWLNGFSQVVRNIFGEAKSTTANN